MVDLNYIDYERENTGRAFLHVGPPFQSSIVIESNFTFEPEHPATPPGTSGHLYLVSGTFKNITQAQAKLLANALLRFSKSGSVLKRGR